MKPLQRRVLDLETQAKPNRPSRADADRQLDERFALEGTSREAIIAEYGSIANWAYALSCAGADRACEASDPNDGLTPEERYLKMIKSEVK